MRQTHHGIDSPLLARCNSSLPAFTIIELLVVIGIISMLIALLLPALNRARDQAKTVSCYSQLAQMGQAEAIYVANNHGFEYPENYSSVPNPSGSGTLPNTSSSPMDVLNDYLPYQEGKNATTDINHSIWRCPSVPLQSGTGQYQLTYGFNQGVHIPYKYSGLLPYYSSLPKLSQFHRTTEQISVADGSLSNTALTTTGDLAFTENISAYSEMTKSTFYAVSATTISGWSTNVDGVVGTYHVRWRHNRNDMVNVLFLDGHCGSFRYSSQELKCGNFAVAY